jgi:hypothetical protein
MLPLRKTRLGQGAIATLAGCAKSTLPRSKETMNYLRWANSWRAHNLSSQVCCVGSTCVQELVAEEVLRRGTWPEDTAEWTWRDAASYCAARECVERETEIGAAYVQAMNAVEACHMRIDPICTAILALKARTREGRAVKKMARAIRTGHWRG